MSDEEINKLILDWQDNLIDDGKLNVRMVGLMCQEVERMTRQKAVRSARMLAEAIDAGVDVRKVLEAHAGL